MKMRLAIAAAVMSFSMAQAAMAGTPALLPSPQKVTPAPGVFDVSGTQIMAEDAGARAAARRLRDLVARSGGPALALSTKGAIRFRRDPSLKQMGAYRLTVTPKGAVVSARDDAGLFYGAETLWQIIAASQDGRIDAVVIDDAPAFGWRGVMLDSARHFQPVSYVKSLIDRMAMAKLNTLHWHLSDDQGWRIAIDRYPRLTSIGAWRRPAGAAGTDPKTGKPVRYGGFYTKDEIRDVVAYAKSRHVTIVPEIDMPGHATAIIAAYPDLASTPNPPREPSNEWGILPNLLNPDEATLTFVEHVLDEVIELFPGTYIHVGGDEAVKDQWKANPAIQARIRRLGLRDENALQGWFMAQLGAYLKAHGRRLIGWDEILEGKVPADATVMSWRGIDGAVTAAKAGHDTVLSPAPILYLDNRQSDAADEPPGRGQTIDWQHVYAFDPSPAELTPEQRRHILGVQGNLWTEHVRTTDYATKMLWPRAAIIAEIGWRNPKRNWPDFSQRLVTAMHRWDRMGLGYDVAPLEPMARFTPGKDALTATLRQPAGIGTIRYTMIGAAPGAASPAYSQPISVPYGAELVAQAFDGDTPLGTPRRWLATPDRVRTIDTSSMELCGSAIPLRVEDDGETDGVRAVHPVDVMHPCWIWRGAPMDGMRTIRADVGRLPFNFAIGKDIEKLVFDPPATKAGEMVVRRDSCDGPVVANVPLASAVANSGVSRVNDDLKPQTGTHDLCITFTQKGPDPYWVVDRLTLTP
ncbi:family 20 glycosylhydrolase [Stakelama sp. CBK3Z-3]|uniref:beta-N-acetylhexosaminidase n=1 Tax=Stakelama flava TaxID=2860338 RepID=A0ABS6XJ46_9SPHN|nr:family 20 glycosylhydrolase [Stakelama flava]MBW4330234.1 family 20 glycosylhydrolase [Stakelama flava]